MFNSQADCTLTITTNHKQGGMYAVAVTIEDRPKTSIMLDGQLNTPKDVISSIPLQVRSPSFEYYKDALKLNCVYTGEKICTLSLKLEAVTSLPIL